VEIELRLRRLLEEFTGVGIDRLLEQVVGHRPRL
jgi:hypothetical protein